MVKILIMSAKMTSSVYDVSSKNLSHGANYIMDFYTSLSEGLKLKVRKFWGLIPTFVEVTGEKLVGGAFYPRPSPPS